MQQNKLGLFIGVPLAFSLVFIGFYFSGNQFLQYLIAPQFDWLHHRTWREFGLLEQSQNVLLLTIIILFLVEVRCRPVLLENAFFLVASLLFLLLLLEEVDYGIHFYEYLIGQESSIEVAKRNWHNQDLSGRSLSGRLKKVNNLLIIVWFILAPLLAMRFNFKALKAIIPSPWFVASFMLVSVLSALAHVLDDRGMAYINGIDGALNGNISEFRETSTYYLYLLYALQLIITQDLFSRKHKLDA